ncbi:HEPN domain-containing protein [Pseudomonas sp.]|jgi:hypothetical protein|uniref:ApeA N-terminal domain 1-containing protein n=1 Tax=Pseudomonas sp. TaxID=306 RepID=UPI0031B63704
METELVRSGYFWIPNLPNDKVPGTLTIGQGGLIELELVGGFADANRMGGQEEFSRLLGSIEKEAYVTLEDCFYIARNVSFGGISKSRLRVGMVFGGVQYSHLEKPTFNSLSFSTDLLDEWVGISGIKADSNLLGKSTIEYLPPKPIPFSLPNGMNMEIAFHYSLPGTGYITEAVIRQKTFIKLSSSEELPLEVFLNVAKRLNNFLCFAVDQTLSLKDVTATSPRILYNPDEPKYLLPIKIYYPSLPHSEKQPRSHWRSMLFSYRIIKDNADEVLNKWFTTYELIEPAINLYFSTKAGGHTYLESKFLALAQGLETYHRRTSDEALMSDDAYNSLVQQILGNCPEGHEEWLEGRLSQGNSLSFYQRLVKIIRPFGVYFGNSSARSSLARKISLTRNYLTHYNKDLEADAASGDQLYELCNKMEALFQLHFLQIIGFTQGELKELVDGTGPLRHRLNQS